MANSFEAIVDDVLLSYKDATIDSRNAIAEEVTEAYVMEHGKKPDSFQLTRLANLLLQEDIKNPDSYKVQKEAYPFHSDTQAKRRKKKEFVAQDDKIEYMNYKVEARLSTAPPKDNRR